MTMAMNSGAQGGSAGAPVTPEPAASAALAAGLAPEFVVVIAPAGSVLVKLPGAVVVTSTVTVQLPLGGTLPPDNAREVPPASAVTVPPQVVEAPGERVLTNPEG